MPRCIMIVAMLLCGCSSMPSQHINMSLSELGNAIEASDGEPVRVESTPHYHHEHPDVSLATRMTVHDSYTPDDDWIFTHSRVLLNYRKALNRDDAPYHVVSGLELAFVGGDSTQQVRAAIHVTGADFNSSDFDAFHNPVLAGFDLDYHRLLSTPELTYLAGVRISAGIFGYGLNSPVNVNYQEYNSDTLGYVGLGVPVGLQMDVGPIALEAILTPTVHLFSEFTDIGFFNDILQVNTLIPFSFGVGYAW